MPSSSGRASSPAWRRRALNAELEPELQRLFDVLARHPAGISEHQLLEELQGQGRARDLPALELFRVHFLLFHHLHRLRVALESQGRGGVHVHCLDIRLLAPLASDDRALPAPVDPLAAYYLDLENLARETQASVEALLEAFWTRFGAWTRRDEALAVLGLPPEATPEQIRTRFHLLCLEHHPDRGGDEAQFRRVSEAMESLRAGAPRTR